MVVPGTINSQKIFLGIFYYSTMPKKVFLQMFEINMPTQEKSKNRISYAMLGGEGHFLSIHFLAEKKEVHLFIL